MNGESIQLIDTHCHLDVSGFDADRAQVLGRARAAGVKRMVVPAVDAAGWEGLLALCRSEAGLYPALGLHPIYTNRHLDRHLDELEGLVARTRPLAIGEIGLDYYVPGADRERQQQLLEAQLALAERQRLPVLLHVRKAHDAVLQALRRYDLVGGIAHAFNGSLQQAEQYLSLGFKLGFGGMLTYERSQKLRRLAVELPLEALVLETDAPDMSPQAHQGERNSPEYLPEVAASLAGLRGLSLQEVAAITTANASTLLGLPTP